ncbi:type IV pilus biogenesis/stability protein PilW [Vibrio olivae]|uniref:Type IV pilus biogenesis/stability protein PilW n=1 Tax=Vibrio olivae TaxID=1243002 RepID=A0ABV5HKX3_9VIBR
MRHIGLFIMTMLLNTGCANVSSAENAERENKANARIALGLAYLKQGDHTKAWQNLLVAQNHAPRYLHTQLALAHYYTQVNELERAESLYLQTLKDHPNNGDVMNNYGTFLCHKKDYQHAERWLLKAIKQRDYVSVATSYENMGLCALKAHHDTNAMTYFAQSVKHDPRHIRAWQHWIALLIQHQRISQAEQQLKTYLTYHGADKHYTAMMLLVNAALNNEFVADDEHDVDVGSSDTLKI